MLPIAPRQTPDPTAIATLEAAGLHPVVAACFVRRGVSDPATALHRNPLLHYRTLKGVDVMAPAIAQAIRAGERMVVVADYDCDGATACAVAVSGLAALGADIDFVVPNRMVHGYGLTPSVVELAAAKSPRWIITVDNGIASVDGVRAAKDRGIGVWVTDHHLPGKQLPDADAIVNPNQPGCLFQSKNLAGVGVMWYVFAAVRALMKAQGDASAATVNPSDWLDLVALGTVADVVRLDENNRWLVNQGLRNIRAGHMRHGIRALFAASSKDPCRASAQDFGFGLGPRLNAAGRLDDMSIGIRCLLAESEDEAFEIAGNLHRLNEERKQIEAGMKAAAADSIDALGQTEGFTRVVFGEDFHEGVIGIVAGRIKERDFAPTVVFARGSEPGQWKGSARSIPGLHLRDVLDNVYKQNPEWFVKFGGHAMAAGLTVTDDARTGFAEAFEAAVKTWFEGRRPTQELAVDGPLPFELMNVQTADAIQSQVWGQGFEEPLWVGRFDVLAVDWIGKDANHLRLHLRQEGTQAAVKAMHFFQDPDSAPEVGQTLTLAYRIQVNEFRGEQSLDILIVDR